jgi:hypothetical protein
MCHPITCTRYHSTVQTPHAVTMRCPANVMKTVILLHTLRRSIIMQQLSCNRPYYCMIHPPPAWRIPTSIMHAVCHASMSCRNLRLQMLCEFHTPHPPVFPPVQQNYHAHVMRSAQRYLMSLIPVTSCIVDSTAPYIMVVKFRSTIWPPPPQLSLHRRAALSSNSNGTRSVYSRENPKSSLQYIVRCLWVCSSGTLLTFLLSFESVT